VVITAMVAVQCGVHFPAFGFAVDGRVQVHRAATLLSLF
jgi:hypothetical protein